MFNERDKMKYSIVTAALLLAGCAPSLVSSNSAGGTISLGGVVQEQRNGMKVADAECAKYGKVAVNKGMNIFTDTMRYECVNP
jgi:hypothetical protein